MDSHRAFSPILVLLTLAAFAGRSSAQQLVLPDNMNLGTTTSASTVWRSTAGRFQVAYDSSQFTTAGVTGPILVTRLRFRAEDGQPDLGGQIYSGVTVEVGDCAVDYASMSTTFASNRGLMGTLGTTNVTVLPVDGGIPNEYAVDIDLVAIGATFLYDPSLGTDLLVDISFPAPSPATNLVPFSVGSSTASVARGRMMTSGTTGATTGASSAPPTMLVDFAGVGGYATHNAARSERFGAGCAEAGLAAFYQDWQTAEAFDLAQRSLMLIPNSATAPTGYLVVPSTNPPDLTKLNAVADSTADDALVTHSLGFTFVFPTGSTTQIKPCTNGYVWLDPSMTLADSSPAVLELIGSSANYTARLAPCWYNLHAGRNTATHPNAGLHVLTDTSGGPGNAVCYVTWHKVGVYNQTAVSGTAVSDFQCVLHEATGVVEFRYGGMQITPASLAITGWSPGRVGSVAGKHPGPRDLSHELPFSTQPDGMAHALTHNVSARPIVGSPFTLQSFNQPTGTVFGAMLVNFAPQQPALPMPALASGCGVSLSLAGLVTLEMYVAPTGAVNSSPITIPPGFMGLQLFTQYVALDGLGNAYTSNGLMLTIGLN